MPRILEMPVEGSGSIVACHRRLSSIGVIGFASMGATYLMSYPAAKWTIRGGEEFSEQAGAGDQSARGDARVADLVRRHHQHGGRILVMPPAEANPPLTGMMYTANAGALFKQGDSWTSMLSKMSVAHRQAEQASASEAFWGEASMPTVAAEHTWEGQADVATLPGNRFLLTWGVRSVKESLDEVKKRLPPGRARARHQAARAVRSTATPAWTR